MPRKPATKSSVPAISTGRAPRRSTTRPTQSPASAETACMVEYAPATRAWPPKAVASGTEDAPGVEDEARVDGEAEKRHQHDPPAVEDGRLRAHPPAPRGGHDHPRT